MLPHFSFPSLLTMWRFLKTKCRSPTSGAWSSVLALRSEAGLVLRRFLETRLHPPSFASSGSTIGAERMKLSVLGKLVSFRRSAEGCRHAAVFFRPFDFFLVVLFDLMVARSSFGRISEISCSGLFDRFSCLEGGSLSLENVAAELRAGCKTLSRRTIPIGEKSSGKLGLP